MIQIAQCRSKFVLGVIVLLGICPAPVRAAPLSLSVEPIIGYERTQILLPKAHTVNRLMYGGRVTAGLLLLSAEGEYTHGAIDETFPNTSQSSASDRLKLGLRSSFGLGRLFSFYLRGGVDASQEITSQTVNGVTTTTRNGINYNPYGGAGIRVGLGRNLALNAGVVAIVPNFQDMNQNTYQLSAGFTVRFP
jgi:hypothetical protein